MIIITWPPEYLPTNTAKIRGIGRWNKIGVATEAFHHQRQIEYIITNAAKSRGAGWWYELSSAIGTSHMPLGLSGSVWRYRHEQIKFIITTAAQLLGAGWWYELPSAIGTSHGVGQWAWSYRLDVCCCKTQYVSLSVYPRRHASDHTPY